MKEKKHLSILTVLLSMLSVQSGASIAKSLFHWAGPAGATTLRLGIAGILLALVHRPRFFRFSRQQWMCAFCYGVCIGVMNLTFYYGIQRIPLGLGVTVEFIGPLSLAFITSRKPLDFLWAALASVGVFLIVPWKGSAGGIDLLGLLFVFIAGVLWAGYILIGAKITRMMKSSEAVTSGMCIAALIVFPFGLWSGDLNGLNGYMLLYGFGVAVFSSALPFTLDLFSLRNLSSKTYSILQSLQPAFAAMSGLIFLGEMLTLSQWIAIGCVIAASLGTSFTSSAKS